MLEALRVLVDPATPDAPGAAELELFAIALRVRLRQPRRETNCQSARCTSGTRCRAASDCPCCSPKRRCRRPVASRRRSPCSARDPGPSWHLEQKSAGTLRRGRKKERFLFLPPVHMMLFPGLPGILRWWGKPAPANHSPPSTRIGGTGERARTRVRSGPFYVKETSTTIKKVSILPCTVQPKIPIL